MKYLVTSVAALALVGTYALAQQPTPPVTIGIEQRPDAGKAEVVVNQNRPEATLKKWNGEANLKVSIPSVAAESRKQGNTFRYGRGNEQVVMRELENGFKIDIVSHTNQSEFVFELDNTENLVFEYQLPLDEKYPDAKNCSPIECDTDGDGEIDTRRPEHIVDSYAVYHKTKKNHRVGDINYATGKAYHIDRIKVIDANGEETWGYMDYADGQLTVGADPSWVAQAAKPVTFDPTFGYETVGGSNEASATDFIVGSKFTLSEDGDVESIDFHYGSETTGSITVEAGIYQTGGSFVDDTNASGVSTGWNTRTYSPDEPLTAGDYWLVTWGNFTGISYDDVGTANATRVFVEAYDGTFPDPHPDFDAFGRTYSIHATYNATGGGTTPTGSGVTEFFF